MDSHILTRGHETLDNIVMYICVVFTTQLLDFEDTSERIRVLGSESTPPERVSSFQFPVSSLVWSTPREKQGNKPLREVHTYIHCGG